MFGGVGDTLDWRRVRHLWAHLVSVAGRPHAGHVRLGPRSGRTQSLQVRLGVYRAFTRARRTGEYFFMSMSYVVLVHVGRNGLSKRSDS